MPKRRYDDEVLRKRALELRARGLSYREIAKELGCSVFKAHQLISPYESPRSRVRQVLELAGKVEELNKRVSELNSKLSELESRLSQLKPLEDIVRIIHELREGVSSLSIRATKLEDNMDWIRRSVSRRLRDPGECMWIDKNGYCTKWFWEVRVEGWDMREYVEEGRRVYHLNVRKHLLACTSCPSYKPRGLN
jgi:transcriptional regulator with XRE-family HTH domain